MIVSYMKNNNTRKNKIQHLADEQAEDRDKWINNNRYFYDNDYSYMQFLVGRGKRVLELGCGTGQLLNSLSPSYGLGVDLSDKNAQDDIVVREVHLIKDEPVLLKFRSKDVIHSAYLPHFRVQMNCVPGMTTQFAFTPTKTTAEMRETEGEDFDYILLCNKICGVAHYNMQMKFVVETKEEHDIWLAQQKTLKNT